MQTFNTNYVSLLVIISIIIGIIIGITIMLAIKDLKNNKNK